MCLLSVKSVTHFSDVYMLMSRHMCLMSVKSVTHVSDVYMLISLIANAFLRSVAM